jgi:hypothetical protein
MRSLSRPRIGVLLLAAALVPQAGAAASAAHPLDPAAPAGVVPTQNIFENAVPLLNRESPVPSFVVDGPATADAPAEAPPAEEGKPMDHGGMDHGAMGHGAPQAE